jgi:hypothetical protein
MNAGKYSPTYQLYKILHSVQNDNEAFKRSNTYDVISLLVDMTFFSRRYKKKTLSVQKGL